MAKVTNLLKTLAGSKPKDFPSLIAEAATVKAKVQRLNVEDGQNCPAKPIWPL